MANPAVVVLRGSSTTAPHVRGTHEEVDAPQTAPLLQRSLDNEDSVYHENRLSFVGFLRISAARIKTWMLQTNAQQCTSLFLVLVLSSTVTSLATYAIQDQINVWLAVMLSASVVVCFVRDGRTLSLRSTLLLGGALLLVAAPLLSAPVLVLLAAMMVLPLQWLIHRHRQDVTLEMVKEPPLARVKAMDVHPSQDVLALAYYTGHLVIWNVRSGIATSAMILSAQQPLRSVRFLNHPNDQCLLVAAGDDGSLVLVDGTTLRTLANVPAHSDFVRSVDVHPTRPFLLSCSDDRTVKVWSVQGLDRGCGVEGGDEPQLTLCQVLESHDDFVMQVRYHPGTNGSSSSSSFVSASLDRTLMKWESRGGDDGPMVPVGTFRGHTEGVNCIAFGCSQHSQEVGTAVISGSDDGTIKIWDYETLVLLRSIDAHSHNVTSLTLWRPSGTIPPVWVSTCEDGTCRAWTVDAWHLEGQWSLDLGRAWCSSAAAAVGSGKAKAALPFLALGFDQGCVVFMPRLSNRPATELDCDERASTAPLLDYGIEGNSPGPPRALGFATAALQLTQILAAPLPPPGTVTSTPSNHHPPEEEAEDGSGSSSSFSSRQRALSVRWECQGSESGLSDLWVARLVPPPLTEAAVL